MLLGKRGRPKVDVQVYSNNSNFQYSKITPKKKPSQFGSITVTDGHISSTHSHIKDGITRETSSTKRDITTEKIKPTTIDQSIELHVASKNITLPTNTAT